MRDVKVTARHVVGIIIDVAIELRCEHLVYIAQKMRMLLWIVAPRMNEKVPPLRVRIMVNFNLGTHFTGC
jgi:hypothetical protein